MEAAKRLTQLAADKENLQEALKHTGQGVKPAALRGSEKGFLSGEARQRRIAEIVSQIKELEGTEQRLILELQARNQGLADMARLREELQSAERAVRGANYEVRESDRHDLAEAERELDEATATLVEAEKRLPLATREVRRLRRLLNEKVAGINTIIAEAKPISGRAAALVEAGRFQQCAFLRSSYIAALRQARGQCEEEAACLAPTLPGMPDEISTLISSIDAVDCGYSRKYSDTDLAGETPVLTVTEKPRRQHRPAATEVADNPSPANESFPAHGAAIPTGDPAMRGVTANPAAAKPGAGQEPVCSGCMVSETNYGSGLVYLFEAVHSVRNAICSNGSVRSYELFMLNPDRDDEGKPLPRSEQAERYAQSKATMTGASVSKLCGPCSSQQQARLMMRNRCPNPNDNTQSGPEGATLDSRRVR